MPIEFKREGNACEKCKKSNTEVGPITDYTNPYDGYRGLLCSKCIKRQEKSYTEICPVCKRIAYEHGGMTVYTDSDADDSNEHGYSEMLDNSNDYETFGNFDDFPHEEPPDFQEMCMECHTKKVSKVRKNRKIKSTIKNFFKDHYWKIIGSIIGIVAIVVGLSRP